MFVSSTFRDMQDERDFLVKHTFLQLRKFCDERRVDFAAVDLRWGITVDQAQRGDVLPICFAEIERCRPYFIGLLGAKYGTVPREIPPALANAHRWLSGNADKSNTELEILFAALEGSSVSERALFYLRAADLTESESPPDREKLDALKERIRSSGLPFHEGYTSPEELSTLIFDDLTAIIDEDFPLESTPGPLEIQAAEQHALVHSRAGDRIVGFVGRQAEQRKLTDHVRSDSPPLVVVGESGVGKTALLANWARKHRRTQPDTPVLLYSLGATREASDCETMLKWILGELIRTFDLSFDVPSDEGQLRATFWSALSMAGSLGRLVLIIDALNMIEVSETGTALGWLPEKVPKNVRIVVSTLGDQTAEDLGDRGWEIMELGKLARRERRHLIDRFLSHHGKNFEPEHADAIICHHLSGSPLFLNSILEQVKMAGSRPELDERLGDLLDSSTMAELFRKILHRWERDYNPDDGFNMVGTAMALIWVSRRGLSEAELLAILGGGDKAPFPQRAWSPLFLASEYSLTSHDGRLNFFHDYLREAVWNLYLTEEGQQVEYRQRVVDYFESSTQTNRRADELPWQQAELGNLGGLKNSIVDIQLFVALRRNAPWELHRYWLMLQDKFDAAKAYQESLLEYRGQASEAELADALTSLGHFFETMAEHALPEKMHSEALGIRERVLGPQHLETIAAATSLALSLEGRQRFGEAEKLHRRAYQARVATLGDDHEDTLKSLNNIAVCLRSQGKTEEGVKLQLEALRATRTRFGPDYSLTLRNGAQLVTHYQAIGELEKAEELSRAAADGFQRTHGPDDPLTLIYQASLVKFLFETDRYGEAEQLARSVLERRRRVLGEGYPDTLFSMLWLSRVLIAQGGRQEAIEVLRECWGQCKVSVKSSNPLLVQIKEFLSAMARMVGESQLAAEVARFRGCTPAREGVSESSGLKSKLERAAQQVLNTFRYQHPSLGFSFDLPEGWYRSTMNVSGHQDSAIFQSDSGLLVMAVGEPFDDLIDIDTRSEFRRDSLEHEGHRDIEQIVEGIQLGVESNAIYSEFDSGGWRECMIDAVHRGINYQIKYKNDFGCEDFDGVIRPLIALLMSSFSFPGMQARESQEIEGGNGSLEASDSGDRCDLDDRVSALLEELDSSIMTPKDAPRELADLGREGIGHVIASMHRLVQKLRLSSGKRTAIAIMLRRRIELFCVVRDSRVVEQALEALEISARLIEEHADSRDRLLSKARNLHKCCIRALVRQGVLAIPSLDTRRENGLVMRRSLRKVRARIRKQWWKIRFWF